MKRILLLLIFLMCVVGLATAAPVLTFEGDTPVNNTKLDVDYCTIEMGIAESDLDTFQFNWQNVYYPVYNDNLVFCMPLNNIAAIGETGTTAIDISTYGNDGTGTIDWSSAGRFNGAVYFDDDADVITIPTSDSLNITQGALEVFVYPTELGRFSTILDKGAYFLKITNEDKVHFGSRGDCDPYTWTQVYESTTLARYAYSLETFNDYLYSGSGYSAIIHRTPTGAPGSWVEAADLPDNYVYDMQEYNGSLYAGTGSYGRIYNTTDGLTWDMVYDTPDYYAYCLAVFEEYIYVGTGNQGKIYRYSDTTGWNLAYDLPSTASYVRALTEFNGYLYAGTGYSGQIYRSNDGTTWTLVHDDIEQYIYSLEVFNGSLYAGTGNGAKILRSTDGTTWSEVIDLLDQIIYTLKEFNGSIFAGVSDSGKIYMSPSGDTGTWVQVVNTDETYMYCFEEFNGCLYQSTSPVGRIFKMSNGFDVYSTSTLSTEYTQITGTYDEITNTASLHINGALENSVSERGIGQTDNNLTIGESFRGRVDEVRISDTPPTSAQVGFNYNTSIYQTDTDTYNYTNDLTGLGWGCYSYFGMAENTSSEQGISDTYNLCICYDIGALNITDVETYSLSDETVRIKWETSRLTNNVVYYSLNEADINPVIDQNASMSEWSNGTMMPRIQLFNLIPSKNYFYKVYSVDQCDNDATSSIYDFYTTAGTNRMPVIVYLACCVLVFVLMGATVLLRTNEEYLDVLCAFLTIFLAFMCAQLSISQKVYTAYSEITSTDETILVYDTFNSVFVHWFFMLVGVLMVLYTCFLIIEILIYTYKNIIDRRYNDL